MIWQFSHGSHSHIHSLLNKNHHLPPLCTLSCPSCLSCPEPLAPPRAPLRALAELPTEAALAAAGLVRLSSGSGAELVVDTVMLLQALPLRSRLVHIIVVLNAALEVDQALLRV